VELQPTLPCVAVAPVWLAGTKVMVVIDPQRSRGRSHGKDFKVLGDVDKLSSPNGGGVYVSFPPINLQFP